MEIDPEIELVVGFKGDPLESWAFFCQSKAGGAEQCPPRGRGRQIEDIRTPAEESVGGSAARTPPKLSAKARPYENETLNKESDRSPRACARKQKARRKTMRLG